MEDRAIANIYSIQQQRDGRIQRDIQNPINLQNSNNEIQRPIVNAQTQQVTHKGPIYREEYVQKACTFQQQPAVLSREPKDRVQFQEEKGQTSSEIAEAHVRCMPSAPETPILINASRSGKLASSAIQQIFNTQVDISPSIISKNTVSSQDATNSIIDTTSSNKYNQQKYGVFGTILGGGQISLFQYLQQDVESIDGNNDHSSNIYDKQLLETYDTDDSTNDNSDRNNTSKKYTLQELEHLTHSVNELRGTIFENTSNTRQRLTMQQTNYVSLKEDLQDITNRQEKIEKQLDNLEILLKKYITTTLSNSDIEKNEQEEQVIESPSVDTNGIDSTNDSNNTVTYTGSDIYLQSNEIIQNIIKQESENSRDIMQNIMKELDSDKAAQFFTFMASVTRNLTRNPQDEKSSRFYTNNTYIKDILTDHPICNDFIISLGFTFISSSRASYFPQKLPSKISNWLHTLSTDDKTTTEQDNITMSKEKCFCNEQVDSIEEVSNICYNDCVCYVATVLTRYRLEFIRDISAQCLDMSRKARQG